MPTPGVGWVVPVVHGPTEADCEAVPAPVLLKPAQAG